MRWRKWFRVTSLGGISMAHAFASAQSQWTTTDMFQMVTGLSSGGEGLATNQMGEILAGGTTLDSSGTFVGAVRKSMDSWGGAWQTTSTFNYLGATGSGFQAVCKDGHQMLYAAARYAVSGGPLTWL